MVNAAVLAAFATGSVPAGSHQHSPQAEPSLASRKG
jgi:hypothetical protein